MQPFGDNEIISDSISLHLLLVAPFACFSICNRHNGVTALPMRQRYNRFAHCICDLRMEDVVSMFWRHSRRLTYSTGTEGELLGEYLIDDCVPQPHSQSQRRGKFSLLALASTKQSIRIQFQICIFNYLFSNFVEVLTAHDMHRAWPVECNEIENCIKFSFVRQVPLHSTRRFAAPNYAQYIARKCKSMLSCTRTLAHPQNNCRCSSGTTSNSVAESFCHFC